MMVNSDHTSIDRLSFPEQFVLWAARNWVDAFKAQKPILSYLRPGFDMACIPDGLFALDELMSLLAAAALRPLDFRCTTCRMLGGDEDLLLRCLAACQQGRPADADRVLTEWLPPTGARMALRPTMILALVLYDAGLRLPERSLPEGSAAEAWTPTYADPGLSRIQ